MQAASLQVGPSSTSFSSPSQPGYATGRLSPIDQPRRKPRGSARIAPKREFDNGMKPEAIEEEVAAAVAEVCDPLMLMLMLMLGMAEPVPDAAVALKSFWLVMVAVNPVAFLQLAPTVEPTPSTKLTAAH